jgi:gamma-glutamyltranspeptidase/glutathione hydrolase
MVMRTQVYGQNPQAAADAPRYRFVEGLNLAVESSFPEATAAALAAMGHAVTREPPAGSFGFGGAQLIHVIDGGYVAGTDPRKDGAAVAL